MLDYNEIKRRLENKESVMTKEVTGTNLFRMIRDKYIKFLTTRDAKYEMILIEVNYPWEDEVEELNKEKYIDYNSGLELVENFTKTYDNHFILLDDKYYEFITDVLETN